MDAMSIFWALLVVVAGLVVGVVAAAIVGQRSAEQLRRNLEASRDQALQVAIDHLESQHRVALDGDRREQAAVFDANRELIAQQLGQVHERLGDFERTIRDTERHRHQEFGELAGSLASLSTTTAQLREALANSRARGQWGERMAEDVLRLAGFLEGVNYHKQRALASGTIPDFTFLMPNDLSLHMDVKFPLDNYVRFLEAQTPTERDRCRRQFLRDVKDRVKELTGRGYTEGTATIDCLLLFVPNESVFAFVQEHDPALFDEALRRGIVVCSPMTLFAILRVVRQAVDNFRLERTAHEILQLLGEFESQWSKYNDRLDKLSRSFTSVQRDFDELLTTRARQLQRPLDKIQALRTEHDEAAGTSATEGPALRVLEGR